MEIKMGAEAMLSEASFESAVVALGLSTGTYIEVAITVNPINVVEAGRCSTYLSHFSNVSIFLETDNSFGKDEWMVEYNGNFVRSGDF